MDTTENSTVANSPINDQKSKRERSSLCKVLPTDRIAFDRQVDILRAYAACYEANGGKPVSNQEAGDALTPKFSASTIGVAVPFFVDVGLISKKGSDFIPSPELVEYNQALGLSASEAKRKIRPLFEKTWFCRLLVPRLRLSPQTVGDCVGILAIEAKAEKEHLPRVEPLISFLELSGIVAVNGASVSFIPAAGDSYLANPKNSQLKVPEDFSDHEEQSLFLDKAKSRRFTIISPLMITEAEYGRICNWIKATLIVEGEKMQ